MTGNKSGVSVPTLIPKLSPTQLPGIPGDHHNVLQATESGKFLSVVRHRVGAVFFDSRDSVLPTVSVALRIWTVDISVFFFEFYSFNGIKTNSVWQTIFLPPINIFNYMPIIIL